MNPLSLHTRELVHSLTATYRHSSSSAIFERDIELPPFTTIPHPHTSHPPNPHRTPRSKATDPLETSVPSVLDSAATLLATSDANSDLDVVAVEAPLPLLTSTTASIAGRNAPLSGRGSRSPSPTTSIGMGGSRPARTSMLLNLPSPVQGSVTLLGHGPGAASPTSSGGRSPPISMTGSPNRAQPPGLITTTNLSNATSALGEPGMPGGFGVSQMSAPSAPAAAAAAATTSTAGVRSISVNTSSEGSTDYESALSGGEGSGDETTEAERGEGQTAETAGDSESPRTTTMERPPAPLPLPVSGSPTTPTVHSVLQSHTHQSQAQSQLHSQPHTSQVSSPSSTSGPGSGLSYPPSPSHGANTINAAQGQKRLSFLAYADVRAGAPVSTRPLSALTYANPTSTSAAGTSSPGSPGSGHAISLLASAPEEPPHLPAVEGALEGVGVLEPSSGLSSGSAASVLGMSFGGAAGYGGGGGGYGAGYGGYGSRSASAATSARNSLVLDALPAVLSGLGAGSPGVVVPHAHTHAHMHAHAPGMGVGARPHSVYSHGAAADVKEPGSTDGDFGDDIIAGSGGLGGLDGPSDAFSGAGIGSASASGRGAAEWEREGLGRGLEERLEAVLVGGGGKV